MATFIKITNREIYDRIVALDKKINSLQEIKEEQTLIKKLVFGSYGFSMVILGWLIAHVMH